MATAMVSALTGIPVRKDVAMTGEITLRGRVLPIGGLKSKILAAHLSGAGMVILPKKNEKDLRDIPEEIRKQLKLVLADNMEQVLEAALRRRPKPLKSVPPTIVEGGDKLPKPEPECRVRRTTFPPAGPAAGRGQGRPLGTRYRRGAHERPGGPQDPDRWSTATTTRSSECLARPRRPRSRRRSGSSRASTIPIGTPGTRPPSSGSRTSTRRTPSCPTPTSGSSTTCSASNWEQVQRAGARGSGVRPAADPFGAGRPVRRRTPRPGGNVRYEFRTGGDAGFSDFFRMFFSGAAAGAASQTGGDRDFAAERMARRTGGAGPSFQDILAEMGFAGNGAGGRRQGRLARAPRPSPRPRPPRSRRPPS